jgi:type II secretory pathway pseudopilin PulG
MFQAPTNNKNTGFKKGNAYGFVFLEILIAIALFSIVFMTLLSTGLAVINLSTSMQRETKADSMAREELEAVRNFRDGTAWATTGLGTVNVGSTSPYYLQNNSNNWALVPGTEIAGIFTRRVVFDKVSRDGAKNIESVYNASHDDADTRKITVTITWPGKTMQVVSYLTNWKQ